MNQKRTKWIIAGSVVVAVAAAVVLIITIFGDKGGTVKREPTPTIPAEIPAGSVLVWRRSAEYFTKTGMKERPSQIMQYEYDEYGNYVKSIFDLGDGEETIHQVEEFVHSPLVLEQDKVEHGKEFFCPEDFEP